MNDKRDECRAASDAATKHKLIYVSPDYRAKTSWMGPAAEADVVQIIAELKSKYRVNKVIVSGGSMGGTAALTLAAPHPALVDGVVSMNGTANFVEYAQFQDAIAKDQAVPPDSVLRLIDGLKAKERPVISGLSLVKIRSDVDFQSQMVAACAFGLPRFRKQGSSSCAGRCPPNWSTNP